MAKRCCFVSLAVAPALHWPDQAAPLFLRARATLLPLACRISIAIPSLALLFCCFLQCMQKKQNKMMLCSCVVSRARRFRIRGWADLKFLLPTRQRLRDLRHAYKRFLQRSTTTLDNTSFKQHVRSHGIVRTRLNSLRRIQPQAASQISRQITITTLLRHQSILILFSKVSLNPLQIS